MASVWVLPDPAKPDMVPLSVLHGTHFSCVERLNSSLFSTLVRAMEGRKRIYHKILTTSKLVAT